MHINGTATGYLDLLAKLSAFLTETGSASHPTRRRAPGAIPPVGNGRLTGYKGGLATLAERVVIRMQNSVQFTVVGDTGGAYGEGTVGTEFVSDFVSFTLEAGSDAFNSGDELYLQMAPAWDAVRDLADEKIWRAPGNDGSSSIFTGMKAISGSGYANLMVGSFAGYASGSAFIDQPGSSDTSPFQPDRTGLGLRASGDFAFTFVADGRRVIVVAVLDGHVQAAYLGLALPYANPLVAAPLLVEGGTVKGPRSYTTVEPENNSCFPMSSSPYGASERGTQLLVNREQFLGHGAPWTTQNHCWPWSAARQVYNLTPGVAFSMDGLARNLDGSYPLLPATLWTYRTPSGGEALGQLAGVYGVPGEGLTSGTLIPGQQVDYLALCNVNRTGNGNFFAVELN